MFARSGDLGCVRLAACAGMRGKQTERNCRTRPSPLLDHGAVGLSLRAIARNLGMVSSAVYRYVSSRDELLTLLLGRRLPDLADTADRARDDTVADCE